MTPRDLAEQLKSHFGELLSGPDAFRGEITLRLTDPDRVADVCAYARERLDCNVLLDIASVDNYGDDPRWTVVYELYGIGHRCHLRLKTDVREEVSELPTVSGVWPAANWHEREIYDMMGIRFRGHPDLRRILMWDGYPFFPLRKDFPLGGKASDVPGLAFTKAAPLEGGPFVTSPGGRDAIAREPHARPPEERS
jgi:NADH-quinone oxidoreductase subunit C